MKKLTTRDLVATVAFILLVWVFTLFGAPVASAGLLPHPPNPDTTPCMYVIPIATPGVWMCPEGVSPPQN